MNSTAETPTLDPSVASTPSAVAGVIDSERATLVRQWAPVAITSVAFAVLFFHPFRLLLRDWWSLPEAGHGLLLGPVAVWLGWKAGLLKDSKGNVVAGLVVLTVAIAFRFASGLAAELFTMRGSMVMAGVAIAIYFRGYRQVLHWWLPILLICLSIPLPELVTQKLALPLQFKASELGAALLKTRGIPVLLTGNVIRIPGQELFVTEACSGLRSLTALLSTTVLVGALMFKYPVTRFALIFVAIPIAIVINGVRVFLTGFLVFFVSPQLGQGFMHATEGWLLFLVSLVLIMGVAYLGRLVERRINRAVA
jgi:exosortase